MSSSQARRPRFPRGPAAALLRYQFKTVRPPTKDIVELLPEGGSRTVPRSVLHGSATGGETIFRRSADFHSSPGCNKNRG
uniref:Uncharacterized protein n=1 Tax=Oryza rufipogon TaxID=4529 RepID=A0A0E0NM58_ORYRU